jgi:hypothetical protein
MKRYVIQNKETKEYLKRVKGCRGMRNRWVKSPDDVTLLTSLSSVTFIIRNLDFNSQSEYSARRARRNPDAFKYKCIEVGVLIYPINKQPFIDGVLK